jgi:hypothetical protein
MTNPYQEEKHKLGKKLQLESNAREERKKDLPD